MCLVCVCVCVAQGCDINACDKHGLNAMEYAVMNGDVKAAYALLDHKIVCSKYDYFGLTGNDVVCACMCECVCVCAANTTTLDSQVMM
jgi:ankyrin repeat protein